MGVDLSPEFVGLARDRRGRGRRSRRPSSSSTCATSTTRASSTPCSACARAASGCSAGTTRPAVFSRIAAALAPGGRLALTAFSAVFAMRHLEPGETFDPGPACCTSGRRSATPTGSSASSTSGRRASPRASSSCSRRPALDVDAVHGVTPGATARPADARRPRAAPPRAPSGSFRQERAGPVALSIGPRREARLPRPAPGRALTPTPIRRGAQLSEQDATGGHAGTVPEESGEPADTPTPRA